MDCWFNPRIYRNSSSCRVDFIDRYTQLISNTCYVMVPQYVLRMHVTVYYKFRIYRKFLLELDFNLCDLFENKDNPHPLMSIIVSILQKYSLEGLKCPYQGNMTMKPWQLDFSFIPTLVIPSGQYRVDVRVYNPKTNETVNETKLYLTVPPSRDARVDRSMG